MEKRSYITKKNSREQRRRVSCVTHPGDPDIIAQQFPEDCGGVLGWLRDPRIGDCGLALAVVVILAVAHCVVSLAKTGAALTYVVVLMTDATTD